MLDQVSVSSIVLVSVCIRSDINMSKSDLSVRSDIISMLDQMSVLRIMLMTVYRSDINISDLDLSIHSDINIRSDISVMNQIDAFVVKSDINMSK